VRPLRRLLFPLWFVRVRLANRAVRAALVVAGIAAGAGILAAVLAGGLIAQDRSLARALQQVAPAERTLRGGYFGVPPQGSDYEGSLDPVMRRALGSITRAEPIRVMQLRQIRIEGALVDLAAIDGLERWITLRSGRAPRTCIPARCELVQIAGRGRIPSVPGIRLVRVGTGTLNSPIPFGRIDVQGVSRASLALGTTTAPTQPPLLIADGVAALSGLPALSSVYRGYSWAVPLDPDSVHPWDVDDFIARVTQMRSELEVRNYLFDLTAPDDQLRAADESSRVAGRRLLLIGGEAAGLMLAFAVLAAASMRRDLDAAWRRLTWFGARRWQRILLVGAESAGLALAGTALGWALGIGVSTLLAERAGAPSGAILSHSILSPEGLLVAVGIAAAAALVLVIALRVRPFRVGTFSLSTADVAALGALVALAFALLRGQADARTLAVEGRTGTLLLLIPGLVTFVAAVATARALGPALRLLERVARRARVALRLAALSLARHPGHAAIAVVFLVVSLGLALFAEIYRSTLAQGQADQASFAVPLDFTLREDLSPSGLVRPLQAAPLSRYREIGPDLDVVPVIRLRGSVTRLAGSEKVTLLGVPARQLTVLRDWRGDFASVPLSELARRIDPGRSMALRGPALPASGRELLLSVAVRGDDVELSASVLTDRGDVVQIDLGATSGTTSSALRAPIPAPARGGRLIALTLDLLPRSIESGEPAQGILTLGAPRVRTNRGETATVSDYGDWIGVNGVHRARATGGATLRFFVTDQIDSRFRPRQPTDGLVVPALASPLLAAAATRGGELSVQLGGPRVSLAVVGTVRRFPTVLEGDFVVADVEALGTALNAGSPGVGGVNEVWIGARPGDGAFAVASALERPPFDVLDVRSRRAIEESLEHDPLARGSLLTLAATALVALALALLGLLLLVVSDLRDEQGDLFDLEAQGATPAMLRRHLRLRAAVVVGMGLLGGIVTGSILSALAVDLVALTANATAPEPPLLLDVEWATVALAVVAYSALATVLVLAATWGAFRSPEPARIPEEVA
jgi:hypothetical protein